ncbi:MAG: phage head closure protein [Marinibacterium sp.]
MSAPQLTRVLALEAPQTTPDGAGGFDQSWAVLGTLWAEVKMRSARDRAEAGQTVSRVEYRITVRGAAPGSPQRPLPGQRFRDGARIFAIRAVAEADGDARYLACTADEEMVP